MADIADQLDHPKLRAFYDYWASKRRGDLLPALADIDPVEIPKLLSSLLLMDVVRQDGGALRFRYRLIGNDLVETHQANFTGKWIDDVLPAEAAARIVANFTHSVETLEPHFWRSAMASEGREHVRYARVMCPLADDGLTVDALALVFIFENLRPWINAPT